MKRNDPDRLVLLTRAILKLRPEDFREFVRQLDNPGKPSKALIDLMRSKPPWEKQPSERRADDRP